MEVKEIIQIQENLQLTDSQFAQRLSVDRVTWNRIKNGKWPLNDKFLMRVYKAFPDIFLSRDATRHINIATAPFPNAPQTRCSRFLDGVRGWWAGVVLRIRKLWRNSREP